MRTERLSFDFLWRSVHQTLHLVFIRDLLSLQKTARPDKSWRKERLEMSTASSHWDSQETGTVGGKAGKHSPSLQGQDNNEMKRQNSSLRNTTPRFVSAKRDLSPCTLQRAELRGAGRRLRTLQCHSHTTLQEHAFSMALPWNTSRQAPWHFLPAAPTWCVTVTLSRRHRCQQLSTAWMATHLGNR